MIKLAIIGGIGSGNSVVSKVFSTLGYPVYDSDSRAKWLMANDEKVRSQLIQVFGSETFENGILNRAYLSKKVFTDKPALNKLNGIVHPAVYQDFNSFVERHQSAKIVVIESAILFESGGDKFVDKILLVNSPLDVRIHRVMRRSNLTRNEVEYRILNQKNANELSEKVDFIVENDENHSLLSQINDVIEKLIKC